jgi:tRNA(His) 5'-end guanylyltransferase
MWTKFDEIMLKHGFPKPNFKQFMADNAQTNRNAIKIVYGFGDPYVMMVDKECTYLFHRIQSLNKHIKKLLKLELQD